MQGGKTPAGIYPHTTDYLLEDCKVEPKDMHNTTYPELFNKSTCGLTQSKSRLVNDGAHIYMNQ
jgi:hypothetical protein